MTDMIQSSPGAGIIKTDARGRVHTPLERREQLLDNFAPSSLFRFSDSAPVQVSHEATKTRRWGKVCSGSMSFKFEAGSFKERRRVDRPYRAGIFESCCDAAWIILNHMKAENQRSFATGWRLAAQSWLRGQALITVSSASQNRNIKDQNNQLRVTPLF